MFGGEPSPEMTPMPERSDLPDLSTVYRTHVRDVARWAERLAGPGFDLPDMVHEVFEIAQRRLASFRGDSSLATWLYGITERVVRHRRRKDRLRHWLGGSAADVGRRMPAVQPSQLDQIERTERIARVYRVLDQLSERDRRILILFELEELSGEEIAELWGIKVGNVWLRLHRARERFLKAFQESEPEIATTDASRFGDGRYGHAG
jgi:RNA polymerase sigma-70 factor (ECF subfamily)